MIIKFDKRKYRGVAIARFAVQAVALAATVFGYYYLVQGMGLPRPAFIVLVALAGLFFCGWCCPFGTVQEWMRRLGKSVTGITVGIPRRVDRYLLFLRYVIPVAAAVLAIGALDGRRTFFGVLGGGELEVAAYVFLGVLMFLSLFTDRPFCRYFCGFGAMFGTASVLRLFTVKRDADRCVGCGKCDSSCLMGVEVSRVHAVRDPHCINCFECLGACPVSGALSLGVAIPAVRDARALRQKYFPASRKSQICHSPHASETREGEGPHASGLRGLGAQPASKS